MWVIKLGESTKSCKLVKSAVSLVVVVVVDVDGFFLVVVDV